MNISDEIKSIEALVDGCNFGDNLQIVNVGSCVSVGGPFDTVAKFFALFEDVETNGLKEGMARAGKVFAPIFGYLKGHIDLVKEELKASKVRLKEHVDCLFVMKKYLEERIEIEQRKIEQRKGVSRDCIMNSLSRGAFIMRNDTGSVIGWLYDRKQEKKLLAAEKGYKEAVQKIWKPQIKSLLLEFASDCSRGEEGELKGMELVRELEEKIAELLSQLKLLKEQVV